MNDFVRDKFTPRKGEGIIPFYGEVLAGGCVSETVFIKKTASGIFRSFLAP